jgi:hypothetical protein
MSLYLIKNHNEEVCGSGGLAPPFLTLALDGGEWSASRPGLFFLGTAPGNLRLGGWVNTRAGLDAIPLICLPPNKLE